METADHDILIIIAEGQKELKQDLKVMSDALKEFKTALDQTNARQSEQDHRMTVLIHDVTALRIQADHDHRDVDTLKDEHQRWRTTVKVALMFLTPPYAISMVLLAEYGRHLLWP